MKNQALFSSKDNSKNLKCRLMQILFGSLRVKLTKNCMASVALHLSQRTRCNKGRFWPHVRNKFCCHYNLVKYQYLQET